MRSNMAASNGNRSKRSAATKRSSAAFSRPAAASTSTPTRNAIRSRYAVSRVVRPQPASSTRASRTTASARRRASTSVWDVSKATMPSPADPTGKEPVSGSCKGGTPLFSSLGVRRTVWLAAALAALLFPASVLAGRTSREIMPGVAYIRETRQAYGGPLVLHMLLGPRPDGLYAVRPVLSNNLVTGRETVTSMQRRLSRRATLAGVNGDFFGWSMGYPSGIYLRKDVLATGPLRGRSSLGIGLDGLLRIGRVRLAGTWRAEGAELGRRLSQFNRPLPTASGFALFVPSWGARTPSGRYTKEAILTGVPRTFPNLDRTARVVKVVRGSGHRIPAGGAVLQARGPERRTLVAEARPDTTLTFRLGLDPWWEGVADALGGGPVLVRGGVPVYDAGEWFSSYQLDIRHPRTAVGQLADGRLLLVVADGRSSLSWGLTNRQLADEMVRLGAVEAMALDAGGSSTMAFNGSVLNRPSDGSERAVADSLQLLYYGVYAPRPRDRSFSPNGDGVTDVQG